jgi:hypothetical protein
VIVHYQKDTMVQIHTPIGRLFKQEIYDERKMSLWSNSEDQNTNIVQGRT